MKTFQKTVFEEDLPIDLVKSNVEIAVDTESMGLVANRDRLCVVQLSFGDGQAFLVKFSHQSKYDAPNLKKLLNDTSNLKIFHFARADIAALYQSLRIVSVPCYCTKMASRLARTYTDYHGLKDLCNDLLGIKLNKQHQCSDWGADTLSDEQLNYAASDVMYLHRLKEKLDIILARENRLDLASDCMNFIPLRVNLDLLGWGENIFKHDYSNRS